MTTRIENIEIAARSSIQGVPREDVLWLVGELRREKTQKVIQIMSEEVLVPDLYRLAFMPGCFRCEKCGFTLTKACINPNLEVIGTREQDRDSEQCPNDGTMMVHVTYREQLEIYADRLKEEFERLDRIRAAMVAVFGGTGKGSSIWGQGQWDKGWVAGIQAAILAFDTERKK